jgi:hypothetical protein
MEARRSESVACRGRLPGPGRQDLSRGRGRFADEMTALRRGVAASLIVAVALAGAGCGNGSSISDPKIVAALDLEQTARGYEVGGDPFCTIVELLNDGDEVERASDRRGGDFVIASPDGQVGVLAEPPFAPDCTRRARDALKHLERKQG